MGQAPYLLPPSAVFAILGLISLGMAFLTLELPGRAAWIICVTMSMVLNAVTVALAWRRASRPTGGWTGWRLFGAGVLICLLAKFLLFPLPGLDPAAAIARWTHDGLCLAGSVVMAAGVWKWPWRERRDSGLTCLLGSLVFCLSFMVLPWIGSSWGTAIGLRLPLGAYSATFLSRLFVVGGLASFLIAEEPARIQGPLGWILLNTLLSFALNSAGAYDGRAIEFARQAPWLALAPLTSGALLLAAYTPRPEDAPDGGHPASRAGSGILLLSPFLVVTLMLVVALALGDTPGPAALLIFLVMAGALVWRQYLLQEQLAASNRDMEQRVERRTQELERMQDVVLLNERLNAVVVLGAGLVHDLNKGLDSILSAAEVLQMELERRMKVSGFAVEAIIEAVERSATLSSRVMDFSRQLQEDGEVRDLRRELAALEGILKLLVPCGVHLLLQPGKEPAPVRIHTEDLKQILLNLVANARDALPRGGTIRVAVGKEDRTGETYLDVEDTGTGIPEENREKVFEPFFTTKDPRMANGLGLASVKVLLERAKGRVEVSSAVGVGTRFRLLFPSAPAHAA